MPPPERFKMTDKTGHTPGPWVADLGETYSIRAKDGRVAHCQHVHLTGRRDTKTVAANARLISAAPELLEALVNLLAVHEDDGGTRYHVHVAARAAIAKAEGRV